MLAFELSVRNRNAIIEGQQQQQQQSENNINSLCDDFNFEWANFKRFFLILWILETSKIVYDVERAPLS